MRIPPANFFHRNRREWQFETTKSLDVTACVQAGELMFLNHTNGPSARGDSDEPFTQIQETSSTLCVFARRASRGERRSNRDRPACSKSTATSDRGFGSWRFAHLRHQSSRQHSRSPIERSDG